MGDYQHPTLIRRTGIAIVRPKLHEDTQANRDLFKRWTKLHMHDALSIPADPLFGKVTRLLRYVGRDTEGREEYLYTNHFEDIRLLGTELFQRIPQRLDLENTRALGNEEKAVLPPGDLRIGKKPMIFSIVQPTVGIFEYCGIDSIQHDVESYQNLPVDLATESNAPECMLVTLTIHSTASMAAPTRLVQKTQSSLASFLETAGLKPLYSTVYTHAPDAQPNRIPGTEESQHGKGDWVVCIFARFLDTGLPQLAEQVEQWRKKANGDGSVAGLEINIGVWKGDVFMA